VTEKKDKTMMKEGEFSGQTYKIFIVDDHPIVRKGLSQLIDQEADLLTCGEASDAQSALQILKKLKPDLTIVDISLQGMDGIELTKNIRARYGNLPVLIISNHYMQNGPCGPEHGDTS